MNAAEDRMSPQARIQLVIPCFNPPPGWAPRLVERCKELQAVLPHATLHFLLVDDGSTERIPEAQKRQVDGALPTAQWLEHAVNRGKGAALRTGVSAAKEDKILF